MSPGGRGYPQRLLRDLGHTEAGDEPDYITDLQFDLPEGDKRDLGGTTLTEEHERRVHEYAEN